MDNSETKIVCGERELPLPAERTPDVRDGLGGAGPVVHKAVPQEPHLIARMGHDELHRFMLFGLHVGNFAHLNKFLTFGEIAIRMQPSSQRIGDL